MLSTGAFNALLKTLEEPPKHVKFILATTEPQKLPATILSRCQRFDFKKIPDKDIVSNLEKICKECKIEYTAEALNLIAELSEGAMRDALSILERCAQDGENKIDEVKIKELVGIPKMEYISGIVGKIIDYDVDGSLKITQEVIDEGKDVSNLLWEMIKYVKDILMLSVSGEISTIYSKQDKEKMQELIKKSDKDRLLSIIYTLSKLENDIKWSSQKNVVFQVEMLKLCSKDESMSLEERITKLENTMKNGNVYMNFATDINSKKIAQRGQQSTESSQNVDRHIANQEANVNNMENSNSMQYNNANVSNNFKNNSNSNIDAKSNGIDGPNNNQNSNIQVTKAVNISGPGEPFWSKVIDNLKEERMPMLYSNLMNTKAKILDDMTVGIEFPNGLNSFR
jgi:DNA polymerase-3 subunit gamma/tau